MVQRPKAAEPEMPPELKEALYPPAAEKPAAQAYTPPPAPASTPLEPAPLHDMSEYPVVTPQPPKKKGRTGLVIALILIGGLVCLLAFAAAGFFLVRNFMTRGQSEVESLFNSIATEVPALVEEGTLVPPALEATVESLLPLATKLPEMSIPTPDLGDLPAPSAGQLLTDTYFYDDLSNNDMGWWEPAADEISEHKWEDGAYTILVKQPEYVAWTDVPVDFNPTGAEFDTWVPAGGQGGSFGLICLKQSDEDYYYVEMDISDQTYSIGHYLNGEYQALTSPEWPSTNVLRTGSEVNHVLATCEVDQITLLINSEFVDLVSLPEQAVPGEMAVFGSTWDDMPADGYKVYFDNFNAWVPVQ